MPCVPAASAHIQEECISIFISMNIYFSSFHGVKKRGKRDHRASVEVEVGGGGIIREGNCAQRDEKSLCYLR